MNRISFLWIFLLLIACEPDDVCSENTQTTSRLVIEFFDIGNLDNTKTVGGLFAVGLDAQGNEVEISGEVVSSREKIELPLNGTANQTQFKLYENYSVVNDAVQGNPDVVTVAYTTSAVYVSRACGYKNAYNIQGFSIETDSDLWMVNAEIIVSDVTNENETHVKIFH